MRGEDVFNRAPGHTRSGSPPHAWGRHWWQLATAFGLRFTPTCVGKTVAMRKTFPSRSVHPHMRGEDFSLLITFSRLFGSPPHAWGRLASRSVCDRAAGSPPHAWGRPLLLADICNCPRFTPTCVGKTVPHIERIYSLSVHPHMRGEDSYNTANTSVTIGSPPHAWGRH